MLCSPIILVFIFKSVDMFYDSMANTQILFKKIYKVMNEKASTKNPWWNNKLQREA